MAEKMKSEPNEPKWKKIHLFLDEVCATHISEEDHIEGANQDLNLTGHEIHEYLEFLAQPCDQLILRSVFSFLLFLTPQQNPNAKKSMIDFFRCHYGGHERKCNELFEAVITDEGHCCSFNLMPEYIIYKEEVFIHSFAF